MNLYNTHKTHIIYIIYIYVYTGARVGDVERVSVEKAVFV